MFTFDAGSYGSLHNTDALGTSIARTVTPGMLDFSFLDNTTSQVVKNGTVNANYASFVVLGSTLDGVFTPYTDGGLYTYVLGFNDGLRVDADYDDMVVGLTLAPIPRAGNVRPDAGRHRCRRFHCPSPQEVHALN